MPYSTHLGGWLNFLDLRGTKSLHTFDIETRSGGLQFPLLREAHFHYVAHCCLLNRSNHTYYSIDIGSAIAVRDTSSHKSFFHKIYAYLFGAPSVPRPDGHLNARPRRQVDPGNGTTIEPLTCLNYAELNIAINDTLPTTTAEMPMTTTTPAFDVCDCEMYSRLQDCETCIENECDGPRHINCSPYQEACDSGCYRRRRRRRDTYNDMVTELANSTANDSDVLPEGWFFHSDSPELICTSAALPVSIITQVYRPCDDEDTLSPTSVSIATALMPFSTVETDAPMPSPTATSSEIPLTVVMLTPEPTVTIAMTMSSGDSPIVACSPSIVSASCVFAVAPTTTPTVLSDGWFYPNPNNRSFMCVPINEIPGTTTASAPPTTTTTPPTVQCDTEMFLLNIPNLVKLPTVCSPSEDPFNPCEDLLGEDDVLRSFIWIVITLALLGNMLVIVVFICYSLIIKRTKIELFIVHFFYFNLAVADLLMGVYLFTIAVQDLLTMDNFAQFDVAWRTEGGCEFAGFCAITSTMVSVYVLVVITVERLYTFSRALRKSHTRKITGCILMAVGWGFGILMGLLPLFGVSDYTTTAICLPFDVTTYHALAYVLFLLLFTGLAFTVIAISYVIIFYQVFYRQRATINSVSDKKRWKTELKVALRMGILVLTNFICWFPIALLGIAAAVGNSLVADITFAKWVMVFIFPINACLNPILYSVLSKVFRDNIVLLLGKCGLCRGKVSKIHRHRAGFTPSVTSNRSQVGSEAGLIPEGRRGTIVERFRNFSITSSTADLLGRRSSTMSQVSSEERYRIELTRAQRRRSSEYSTASSEDILGIKVNSRRGSEFSGGSLEEMTTFTNPNFRSSSPVGGSNSTDGTNHKGSPRARISLGAVPEEDFETYNSEILAAPNLSGEGRHNPGYIDHEEVNTIVEAKVDGKVQHNGIIVRENHRIIDSETEKDSGVQESDSGVTTDSEDTEQGNDTVPTTDSTLSPNSDSNSSRGLEVVSIEFD